MNKMAVKNKQEYINHLEDNLKWVNESLIESQLKYDEFKKELDNDPNNKECSEILLMLDKVINCKSQVKTLIEDALKISK